MFLKNEKNSTRLSLRYTMQRSNNILNRNSEYYITRHCFKNMYLSSRSTSPENIGIYIHTLVSCLPITVSDRIKIIETKNFVSEPVTIIVGAPELFVNKGSTINLTCVVRYAPEPPPMMIWSHNSEVSIPWIITRMIQ